MGYFCGPVPQTITRSTRASRVHRRGIRCWLTYHLENPGTGTSYFVKNDHTREPTL